MDDYEAVCVRVEKISTAVQKVKDNLKCSICLDLFDDPVTIKCGHRFCRQCILRVTNNENSCCPNCNKKIQKRSIPKKGETVVEACVKQFQDLVKSIQLDSGIDVLQPQNKVKHTKESTFDFEKPSTSKVLDTPSTSKGSPFSINPKLLKQKLPNPVKSRLSLTKKKADIKSPSTSSDKNTLHKYLSNKSDPVCDQIASQEKVKNWLETNPIPCTSDDHDTEASESIQTQSKNVKDNFNTDQLSTPPEQIYSSPRGNEIQQSDASPVPPPSEASSESKYKATQMRIQEAEEMARKKKMSLSLKEKGNIREKSNVKTPSSVPASSHPDAFDWRRVKQVGREMQVKTFKTLSVSIEKTSPAVTLDDTVPYNSTNNDSKNFSRDSETNNACLDKTPLHMRQKDPVKSENNNSIKKSPQIVIEDYKRRSMDSSLGSTKQEYVTAFNVDENQLNEIIGLVPSTSAAKTPEEGRASLKLQKRRNSSPRLNQASLSKRESNSGQELSDDESTNFTSKATVVDIQNSPLKKSRLSLKKLVASADSKNSSPPGTLDKESKSIRKSLDYSPEKLKPRSMSGSNHQDLPNKTSNLRQKLTVINPSSGNLINNSSTSSSKCFRIVFKKLGRISKKKNTPFLYLGKLNKETCVFFDGTTSTKPRPVIKSSVPVQIDYKTMMDDKNVANLEDFSGDSHSKLISPKSNLQSKSLQIELPSKSPNRSSPANNYEEPMNVDDDFDFNKPGPSNQQMEIDETLPPAKMVVKCNSKLEVINSECDKNAIREEKVEDSSLKTTREVTKHLENKETEEIPSSIIENAPEPSTSAHHESIPKKSKTKVKNCSPIPGCSTKVDSVTKSSSHIQAKVLTTKNSKEKTDMDRIPDDFISISSDDSESIHNKDNRQEVSKIKTDSSRRRGQTISKKSDLESCTDSEVSLPSSKRGKVNVAKQRYSSTSSSSLKTVKKKRTHSESSEDDVGNIIDKWFDNDSDKVTKKPKISFDSEEMVNVSKKRNKTKYSIESSSDEEEEVTFKEIKQLKSSLIDEKIPKAKSESTEVNVNKLTAMPSSMMSVDLFETNDQSMQQSLQPTAQVSKKQHHEVTNKIASPVSSDNQSDKENRSELSRENVTVVDTRQLKKKKSILSKTVENDEEENNQFKRTEHNTSVKNTEEQTDEIESSQKDKDKIVDHFEHESDPYFVRESLLDVTQERIAYKNIEKDLFGVDLSKIHENQIDEVLDSEKFASPTTPQRKPKNSEENDDFDSDNIEATPVARKRHTFRFSSSDSTPKSEINASQMFSPRRRPALIPAITPMKNTKSYPLCHSTPMIEGNNSERLYHTQEERIKIVCSSLTPDNTKMVIKFAEKFNAQFQSNFDLGVTHVVVKVDPETKAGPKTFKYIQGIAFKKHVVSFEWIKDCLTKNKLVDADDEKYDVLDPDGLVSGSKKSRRSFEKLFENFAICCLEPFEKVSVREFKELLSYNGAVIVNSFAEFNLHKDKLKVIVVGSDDLDDDSLAVLNQVEAAAVYFEWVVDSLSQFQILALPPYLCETSPAKVLSLGFPPELLIEEETLEEEDD